MTEIKEKSKTRNGKGRKMSEAAAIVETAIVETETAMELMRPLDVELWGDGDGDAPKAIGQPFEVCDEKSANWFVRRLANLDAERERIKAQAAMMLRGLDADVERLNFLYGAQLERWVKSELERRGGRSKSLRLLQGTCAFRTSQTTFRILSERDALDHAERLGWAVVKIEERIDAEKYRQQAAAAHAETGEVIPGIEIVESRENFTVRFPNPKNEKEAEEAA